MVRVNTVIKMEIGTEENGKKIIAAEWDRCTTTMAPSTKDSGKKVSSKAEGFSTLAMAITTTGSGQTGNSTEEASYISLASQQKPSGRTAN